MEKNKNLILIFLSLIISINIKANFLSSLRSQKNLEKVCITLLAATGISASINLWQKYKNNKISDELEYLKNIERELEKEQKLLKVSIDFIDSTSLNLKSYISVLQQKLAAKDEIFKILQITLRDLSQSQKVASFTNALSNISCHAATLNKNLELFIKTFKDNTEKETSVTCAKELKNKIETLSSIISKIYEIIFYHSSYIDSINFHKNVFGHSYKPEWDLYKNNNNIFNDAIKNGLKIIIDKKYGSQNYFPLLTYASQAQKTLDMISEYNFPEVFTHPNGCQNHQIHNIICVSQEKLAEVYKFISQLLNFVVTTVEYQNEKAWKPEFEKQQMKLQAELKERELKAQAALQAEKNHFHILENDKLKLEKVKKEAEAQILATQLALGKIIDGKNVKEAVEKNNRDWTNKFDSVNLNHAKEISKKEQELSNLKDKITKTKELITKLQDHIKRVPVNPESIEGLGEYIKSITDQTVELKNALVF